MKKLYFLTLASATLISALNIQPSMAEENKKIILDLNNPTNPEVFEFNENGSWKETFNEIDFEYIETQVFGFAHLKNSTSYGGSYWDGYTVSKSTDNDINHNDFINRQWGCMAQGGVDGIGTPFILGYYQEYTVKECNQIIFNDGNSYIAEGFYVNNSPWTTNNILFDGAFTSAFTQGSYLTITATALDEDYKETNNSATFYLADYRSENPEEWILNDKWEWFDLSSLGACYGLNISMNTTDRGIYGANTSMYFALDKLTVTPTKDTSVKDKIASDIKVYHRADSNILNITLTAGTPVYVYEAQGNIVLSQQMTQGNTLVNTSTFTKGVYLVKIANQTFRFIK